TRQSRLVLAGIFSFLAFQTFLNIGMNIGIAPVTGITLPLISSGGSSILSTAICLGIASSISRKSKLSPLIEIK
ncbi:MAG: Cell elongation-specific peptidoglycan biosynthesis regulator RodA, partial [Microgenomates group bacterium GW2011_GWF2_47_9]